MTEFISAYQTVTTLSIGELWAVPIMLRLALIEDLRTLADRVLSARRSRVQARKWERRLAGRPGGEAGVDIDGLLRDELDANNRLSPSFVVELMQWLRDQPSSAASAWQALQRRLEAQGDSPEEMLRLEHQREATEQVAIGNVITSMRLLSSIDWTLFFERVSLVEQILRQDPAGAYARMDFATRDRYRHSVEQLAKGAGQPEPSVARRAVDLASEAQRTGPQTDRRHHVGYYLISRGRFQLEQDVRYTPGVREQVARFAFRHPAIGYLGAIATAVTLTMMIIPPTAICCSVVSAFTPASPRRLLSSCKMASRER